MHVEKCFQKCSLEANNMLFSLQPNKRVKLLLHVFSVSLLTNPLQAPAVFSSVSLLL